jgi:hypothetical protein
MLGKRWAARRSAQRRAAEAEGVIEQLRASGPAPSGPGEEEIPAQEARTLDTPCACGHTRRDHTGLRLQVNGRCLECDCEEFKQLSAETPSEDQIVGRLRVSIAQVDRLQQLVLAMRAAGQDASYDGRQRAPRR